MIEITRKVRQWQEVNEDFYDEVAENGFSTFFDWGIWRFGEASQYTTCIGDEVLEDTLTYMVIVFGNDETKFFHISELMMIDFMKNHFCYNQSNDEEHLNSLMVDTLSKWGLLED